MTLINIQEYLFIFANNYSLIFLIFSYIGLKFDQINENLKKLTKSNKRRVKRAWEHSVLLFHQSEYAKASKSAYMIWVIM